MAFVLWSEGQKDPVLATTRSSLERVRHVTASFNIQDFRCGIKDTASLFDAPGNGKLLVEVVSVSHEPGIFLALESPYYLFRAVGYADVNSFLEQGIAACGSNTSTA